MIRRPPRSTLDRSSAASDVYKRQSEESLRGLVERFGRVCKRRGLKVNVDKSKVMVVSKDSPQCEVMLDGEQLEQVPEFKYLGYVLDEKGTEDAECSRKVVNGRKVAGAIKSLVNVKGLSLVCARVLHLSLIHISEPTRLLSSS